MAERNTTPEREKWIPSAVPFFLLGFAYYLISPIFALRFLSDSNDQLHSATNYMDVSFFDMSYLADAIIIPVSFLVGYFIARAAVKARHSVLDYGSYRTSVPLILALAFSALIVFFGMTARSSGAGFFTGYSTYNILVLGPFSTCAFMSAWFVNYFSNRQIKFLFSTFFLVCSALLLGWGARMFFVLGFMALILGFVANRKKLLKSVRFYVFIVTFAVLTTAVGIAREDDREFNSDELVAVFFSEPLFTTISGALYLENAGGRPVYSVPYDVAASIVHFVPSAIFPGKIDLMSKITYNENLESPFGARALLVNLYSNFGFFYPIYLAIIGFYYGFLCTKARHSVFYRATYFSALPILLLLFYREGLVTIIKVMFFNGLAVPLVVAMMFVALSKRSAADIRHRIARHQSRGISA